MSLVSESSASVELQTLQFVISHSYPRIISIFTVGRNCYISRGGICSIVAFLLYFTGGVVGCFTPKPKPILCRPHKKEEYDSESDDDDDDESSGVDEDGIEEAQDEEKRKK